MGTVSEFRSERHAALESHYPACSGGDCAQGRRACSTPMACHTSEPSERSWFWSDLSVIGIGMLVLVGFICGWFAP